MRFAGESVACYSADSVYDSADECRFPREFLNSLTLPGVPEHCLVLKIGMPVILLRNINPREGLCNGVRLIVKNIIDKRVVVAKVAGTANTVVTIPRINLIVNESDVAPLKWRRRQFPLAQAFAMTINKVQGQTLDKVAVWLEHPVFTHGQFYTAASRVSDPRNIRFFIFCTANETVYKTPNIVFTDVLDKV